MIPDTPVAEIQLNGVGVAPVIDITPSEYDFGMLYVGCDSSQPLTISNIGTADLVVDSFDWSTASNDLSFDAPRAGQWSSSVDDRSQVKALMFS